MADKDLDKMTPDEKKAYEAELDKKIALRKKQIAELEKKYPNKRKK